MFVFLALVLISLIPLIKFFYFYVSDLYFLKHCQKTKGTVIRWIPTSSVSQSALLSWWESSSSWSPIIEYYDKDKGAIQQHEVILPKKCLLTQYNEPDQIEVEFYDKHVRISDERYVNADIYAGRGYFIVFIAMFSMIVVLAGAVLLFGK